MRAADEWCEMCAWVSIGVPQKQKSWFSILWMQRMDSCYAMQTTLKEQSWKDRRTYNTSTNIIDYIIRSPFNSQSTEMKYSPFLTEQERLVLFCVVKQGIWLKGGSVYTWTQEKKKEIIMVSDINRRLIDWLIQFLQISLSVLSSCCQLLWTYKQALTHIHNIHNCGEIVRFVR